MKHQDDIKKMSVESGLIEGLTELRDALMDGRKLEERFTMRTVELHLEPQEYTPQDIKKLRKKLGASQPVFAKLLGVRPKTVQSWEQGMAPPPMARRLLGLIDESPDRWKNVLRGAAKTRATK